MAKERGCEIGALVQIPPVLFIAVWLRVTVSSKLRSLTSHSRDGNSPVGLL